MRNKVGTGILFLLIDVLWWWGGITCLYFALYVEHNTVAILINYSLGVLFLVAASCLAVIIAYFVGEGIDR